MIGCDAFERDVGAALDVAGMPAYLESTNPANVARYEKPGFERIGEIALPGGGPLVDLMWRAPRPVSPARNS